MDIVINDNAKPTKLYKYVTAEGAKSILKNKSIRCSSPVLFNDPFDGQIKADFSFNEDELERYMVERVAGYAYGDQRIPDTASALFKNIYEGFEKCKRDGKQLDEAIATYGGMVCLAMADCRVNNPKPGEPLNWSAFLRDFRISAFSEVHDSITMWSHYANHHKGVCLEFAVVEKGILDWAQKVTYGSDLPKFMSVQEWGDFQLGIAPPDWWPLIKAYLVRKSPEWDGEREWRIFLPKPNEPDELHSPLPFRPEELTAVILGVRISEIDRYTMASLCSGPLKGTRLLQAYRSETSFTLDFEEIGH